MTDTDLATHLATHLADDRYEVVVNHEQQYSLWPADRDLPSGWRAAGRAGTREECLDHIERVWTDLTPASARRG